MEYDILKLAFNAVSPITEEDWQMLEPQLRIHSFLKEEYYLRPGQTEQRIGFITRGSFRWYYINEKGEEVNFHFFLDNNFVVEFESFISQRPSNMYIQAMEDSEVIMLPDRKSILELYATSHHWSEFGRKIAESVYLASANRVQDFLFRNAEERYIQLLKQHPDIFQRVSLTHISSYLGVQGPSLSRIRKRISKG
jgi:CRP-like cAMP-binding protein